MVSFSNIYILVFFLLTTKLLGVESIKPEVTRVVKLGITEPSKGVLYQDGKLWVTRTGNIPGESNKILVFSADGKKELASLSFSYGLKKLYAFQSDTVIALGINHSGVTVVSFIKYRNGKFSVKRRNLSARFLAEEFAVTESGFLFSEIGEQDIVYVDQWKFLNSVAPSLSEEFKKEVAAEEYIEGSVRAMKPWEYVNADLLGLKIFFPLSIASDKQRFWVVEKNLPDPTDDKLVYFDMNNGKFQRIFNDDNRNGLSDVLYSSKHDRVIVSEYVAGNVLVIDARSQELMDVIKVGGAPRQTAIYGNCIVASNDQTKNLSFILLNDDQASLVLEWNIADQIKHLNRPGRISVNAKDGYIYLKSNDICTGCLESRSGVVAIRELSGVTDKMCGI